MRKYALRVVQMLSKYGQRRAWQMLHRWRSFEKEMEVVLG